MKFSRSAIVGAVAAAVFFIIVANHEIVSNSWVNRDCNGHLLAFSAINDPESRDRNVTSNGNRRKKEDFAYTPAFVEKYFSDNAKRLGYNTTNPAPKGCSEWTSGTSPINEKLTLLRKELQNYEKLVASFTGSVQDLREHILHGNYTICDSLELHPDGLPGIFPSGQLSQMSSFGYMEPLVPPMRSPDVCFDFGKLMSTGYLVHDFAAFCRNLLPTSRIVMVDMGAALDFHPGMASPAMDLIETFQKFGFPFDHIYAFELKEKQPSQVFDKVPFDLLSAYHWINVGVDPMEGSKLNPWSMLLKKFTPEDLIIVKLDVDTSWVELPLAKQLINNPDIAQLVDAFYFEHHVFLGELASSWRRSMNGTLLESLTLFRMLRDRGIAAHSWV